MPAYRDPTPEELEDSRDVRVAQQQLSRFEVAVHYLEQAARIREEINLPESDQLAQLIEADRADCLSLRSQCSGRVESRKRPKANPSPQTCYVYVDECGQHSVGAKDKFSVFVLAAVIVRRVDHDVVDAKWKRWKSEYLGSEAAIVHEPDIRRTRTPFRGRPGDLAIAALPTILADLDFAALAVVVNRPDYVEDFGTGPLDASLPEHAYMMALDFLMERTVFALDAHFDGAKATVFAESRGPKEDAQLQHEFARLHLSGTSYVNESWFRQQLEPGMRFLPKKDNSTGLQLADLLARPVAEKVIDPQSDPPRWSVFREKLIHGQETKNSILGLEIVPWRERYSDLWKAERGHPEGQPLSADQAKA